MVCRLLAACCGCARWPRARALPPEVEAALQRARVPQDALAVVLQEAGSGRTVLAHQPQAPMNPASLAKLLTTLAALDQLGPAWTWSTPVWLLGSVNDGVLDGSLVIKGSGDPKLVIERVWLLLRRVQLLGVREIRGDIVLDRSAFAPNQADPADFDGDPHAPLQRAARRAAAELQGRDLQLRARPGARRGAGAGRPAAGRHAGGAHGAAVVRPLRRLAQRAQGRLRRCPARALRRQLPRRLRRAALAGGRCRPGQLQRAPDRGAVARHGRQAVGARASTAAPRQASSPASS